MAPTARRSPRKSPRMRSGGSKLEAQFLTIWRAIGGPPLDREVRFHPTRRWRLDFAHLTSRVAIEIEGGAWSGGRHTRGAGFITDCEKYNNATLLGWTIFRLPAPMVTREWAGLIKVTITNRSKEE